MIHKAILIAIIPCIKIINQLPYFRHQLQKVTEVDIVDDFALEKICKQSHFENSSIYKWNMFC
jgi:hypothetical protein